MTGHGAGPEVERVDLLGRRACQCVTVGCIGVEVAVKEDLPGKLKEVTRESAQALAYRGTLYLSEAVGQHVKLLVNQGEGDTLRLD